MFIDICKLRFNSVLKANVIKTRFFSCNTVNRITLDTVKYVEDTKVNQCLLFQRTENS